MIYTARQLEDLHKAGGNGSVVLPYGARLTPLASDWLRSKKLTIGYSNIDDPKPAVKAIGTPSAPAMDGHRLLWWCDGACGAAKAAVGSQARETSLAPIAIPAEAKNLIKAIKHIAAEVKVNRASGGVLLVETGAAAMIFANRCPSLRAVLGTCLEAVEQGIQLIAANVLVIEYPHKTLSQIKNSLGRFARAGQRALSDDMKQQLQELSSCG
jgi:ribose 5-phosphate isomerase RpiB